MWKKTFFFLSFLAVTAGVYFVNVYQRPAEERIFSFSPESAGSVVLRLLPEEIVTRLRLNDSAKGTEIEFRRETNGKWRISRPVDYPAESIVLDGLISLLKLAPRVRELSLEGLEPSEFGFDKPRLSLCIHVDQETPERCLLVGSDAVLAAGAAYAKWNNEPKYFLVGRDFLAACDKTLYSVRKKQIFTLLEKEIKTIRFRSKKREVEIEHSGKHWTVRKPIQAMLGTEAVDQLLTQLNGLYVKEFLDENQWDDSSFGLKRASRVIQIEFQDGTTQTLTQGTEAVGRDAYYALASEDNTVLLISLGKLNKVEDAFVGLTS